MTFKTRSYLDYYHQARPHQRKENKPLLGIWPEVDAPPNEPEEIISRKWLVGLLKHYERKVA